jgi:hypothetical protein
VNFNTFFRLKAKMDFPFDRCNFFIKYPFTHSKTKTKGCEVIE